MQHILVATDFSETAEAALRQAAKLAALSNAKITLLHVIYSDKIKEALLGLDAMEYLSRAADETASYSAGEGMAKLRDASLQKLDEAINSLHGPQPEIEAAVAEGRPSVEILDFARRHNVDLIVLGTHGRSRIGKAFLGSVADNVIRESDCPVMVVRA